MKRSFESLSSIEVLALAVHVERANAGRFRAFADVFRGYDATVTSRFEELAAEEQQHEARLVAVLERRVGSPIPIVEEAEVEGVIESVDMDDPEHLIFDSMKPKRVYELALMAERGARDFYRRAAAASQDAELVALYSELAEMERDHEAWLESRLKQENRSSGGV